MAEFEEENTDPPLVVVVVVVVVVVFAPNQALQWMMQIHDKLSCVSWSRGYYLRCH